MTVLDNAVLADRLVRAAGFRNLVAHGYGTLDLRRVHEAATNGQWYAEYFRLFCDLQLATAQYSAFKCEHTLLPILK